MPRTTLPQNTSLALAALVLGSSLLVNTGCTQLGPSLGILAFPIPVPALNQKEKDDAFWIHERYERAPILGPRSTVTFDRRLISPPASPPSATPTTSNTSQSSHHLPPFAK